MSLTGFNMPADLALSPRPPGESQGEDNHPAILPPHTAGYGGLEMRPACPYFAIFA